MYYFLLGMMIGVIGIAGSISYPRLCENRKFFLISTYAVTALVVVSDYFYETKLLQESDSLTLLALLIVAVTVINNSNIPLRPRENKMLHGVAVLIVTAMGLGIVYSIPFYNSTWGLLVAAACMVIGPSVIHTLTLLTFTAISVFTPA